ncbi:MAG: flotillin family protein, partial [Clostridium paraputrificum]
VTIKKAEEESEKNLIIEVKTAEASKQAAEKIAEKTIIDADAKYKASQKEAEAIKILVDANVLEESTAGIAEAKVIEAKANAEAKAIEAKALAQVKGDTAMVDVKEKEGTVEADILRKKYMAEAEGIKEKANSMKALDEVGRGHEEFKLKLEKDKEIQLANINVQKEVAESQASVIREALKAAKIDIVGGETMFFDQIIGSIAKGKSYDRLVENSDVLTDIKETFITGDPEYFKKQVQEFVDKFNLTSEDIKNLSIAGAINKMMGNAKGEDKVALSKLLDTVNKAGVAKLPAKTIEIINE